MRVLIGENTLQTSLCAMITHENQYEIQNFKHKNSIQIETQLQFPIKRTNFFCAASY